MNLFRTRTPRTIPRMDVQGVALPVLGFGTSGLQGWRCRRMVRIALALGYRHLDTAQAYGNEDDVGRAIAAAGVARSDVFLTTKLEHAHLGRRHVRPALEASLARLRTDYVDLLMIHWPSEQVPLQETLAAFAELRDAGKVRHIGVCNFTLRHLREAIETCGVTPLCNQVEYHPFLAQSRLLPYMRGAGIALVAYSPLARGLVPRDPVLRRIGARHGKSAAQVALAWLVSQALVAAIPKASSERNCIANAEIFDIRLDADEVAAIEALPKDRRIIDPSWAPSWD